MSRRLRRRYGHAANPGHVECSLNKHGRSGWVVSLEGVPKPAVLQVHPDRGRAIAIGQVEAKKRGVPFVMGV